MCMRVCPACLRPETPLAVLMLRNFCRKHLSWLAMCQVELSMIQKDLKAVNDQKEVKFINHSLK